MPSSIRSNRPDVSERFPVAGFTVRTSTSPAWFEVAVATDPNLFLAEHKKDRSESNFFSTRGSGALPAERGEAVFLLPPPVLARFAGQEHLYYAMATFSDRNRSNPEVWRVPPEVAPFIYISKSFTGRPRAVSGLPNYRGGLTGVNYGQNTDSLAWAGDALTPGKTEPVAINGSARNGKSTPSAEPFPVAAAPAVATALADYDDGFGPWVAGLDADDSDVYAEDGPGIEGPIPDFGSVAAQSLARTLATSPEYPNASRFVPADPGNYRASSSARTIRRIVIHITDGGKNINGTISWFQNPKAKVSSHYVIGQDGEVVQMVKHKDVAWHASSANSDSIGIEHVANVKGLMPTEAEYCASAALVNWLCGQFGVPIDRDHVLGHSEADPHTTHTDCPNSVWDWDHYIPLVASAGCQAPNGSEGRTVATQQSRRSYPFDDGQSIDENWNDVDVVGQPENYSCWATAAALVVGWRDQVSMDIQALKRIFTDQTGISSGKGMSPSDRQKLADALGLVSEPPACYTVEGFRRLLENYGPLWVGIRTDDGWNHAVVVTGLSGDGTEDGTYVKITDPWGRTPGTPGKPGYHNPTPGEGSRYALTYAEFSREYEARATGQNGGSDVQILHAANTGLRTIQKGADQAYSFAAGARYAARAGASQSALRTPSRPMAGRAASPRAQGVLSRAADDDVDTGQPASTTSGVEAADDMTRKLGCIGELTDQGRAITFIQRYVRNLTRAEAVAISDAGFQIVSCYEYDSTKPSYYTRAQGVRDGKLGFAQAQAAGQPSGTPIYYAVDTDDAPKAAIITYFHGIQDGSNQYLADMQAQDKPATAYEIGVYGSGCVLDWCKAQGTASWFWQSFAPGWCGNKKVWPGVNIRTSGRDKPPRCSMRLGHLEGWGNEGGWTISNATAEAESYEPRRIIRRGTGKVQSYSGALGLSAFSMSDIEKMKAITVPNSAKAQGTRMDCITSMNAGLRALYGDSLKNADGSKKALSSTCQDTMAALQTYGLAQSPTVFEFRKADGGLTRGNSRPDHLDQSIEDWILNQADAMQQSAWYMFGLSIMDGYHSVLLTLEFGGKGYATTRLFWVDQINGGFDDVTGGADARVTKYTQNWWDGATPKPKTRATVWPLIP